MKKQINKWIVVFLGVVLALPVGAQSFGGCEMPVMAFQSTSVMQASGSAYSSTPSLDDDGTA